LSWVLKTWDFQINSSGSKRLSQTVANLQGSGPASGYWPAYSGKLALNFEGSMERSARWEWCPTRVGKTPHVLGIQRRPSKPRQDNDQDALSAMHLAAAKPSITVKADHWQAHSQERDLDDAPTDKAIKTTCADSTHGKKRVKALHLESVLSVSGCNIGCQWILYVSARQDHGSAHQWQARGRGRSYHGCRLRDSMIGRRRDRFRGIYII